MSPFSRLLAAGLPVLMAAALGSLATLPNIPTWYAGLKPRLGERPLAGAGMRGAHSQVAHIRVTS